MTKGVSELVKEAESVADSALKGCPAETYALLTPFLEKVIAIAPQMSSDYPAALNSVVKSLLEAQQIDDLIKIADFLNFEMVYILNNFVNGQN